MTVFTEIVATALIAVFLQNSVFSRALGANALFYASRNREHLLGFAAAITYTTTVVSPFIWIFDTFLGENENYRWFMPLLYIGITAAIYVLTLVIIWRFAPKVFKALKKYVHLSVFNCSVVGALFLYSVQGSSIFAYLGYGLGTGIGFLFATYLLYIANERLNSPLVPAAFRGFPVMTVYVGILSLALYAFTGYSTAAV